MDWQIVRPKASPNGHIDGTVRFASWLLVFYAEELENFDHILMRKTLNFGFLCRKDKKF
jgi:hypothetical protein